MSLATFNVCLAGHFAGLGCPATNRSGIPGRLAGMTAPHVLAVCVAQ
jgi:hypothetical protein